MAGQSVTHGSVRRGPVSTRRKVIYEESYGEGAVVERDPAAGCAVRRNGVTSLGMSASAGSVVHGTCCGSLGTTSTKGCAVREARKALLDGAPRIHRRPRAGPVCDRDEIRRKDLEVAERQALDYIDDLTDVETPRWVIFSDFTQFRILDLSTPTARHAHSPSKSCHQLDLLAFLAGYQTSSFGNQQEEARVKAAPDHGRPVRGADFGYDDHDASVFFVRVLFRLYADDAMWGEDQFYEFSSSAPARMAPDLGPQLSMLFQAMNRDR